MSRDQRTTRTAQKSAASRASREALVSAAQPGDALLSEAEMRALVRSEFRQEALPQLQPPPGWHYCWLSMTSQHDPIHKRLRLGYKPVPMEELMEDGKHEGFEGFKLRDGEFAGSVSCNEMILCKIPQARYQAIMAEFHHHMPLEEEQAIRRKVEESATDRNGKKLVGTSEDDEVMKELGQTKAVPEFV